MAEISRPTYQVSRNNCTDATVVYSSALVPMPLIASTDFLFSEEIAKSRDGTSRISHSLEGTQIHHINRLDDTEVCTWHTFVQPGLNRFRKYIGPYCLSIIGNLVDRSIFDIGTEGMVQSLRQGLAAASSCEITCLETNVVDAISLRNHDQRVRICWIFASAC